MAESRNTSVQNLDMTVVALQGHPVSTNAPAVGQLLEWDGTDWTPTTGIMGVTDGSNATAGQVGEFQEFQSDPQTPINAGQQLMVASLALTAGDWDISGMFRFVPGGGEPESIVNSFIWTNPSVANTSTNPGSFWYIPGLGNQVTAPTYLRVSSAVNFSANLYCTAGAANGRIPVVYMCARRMR